MTSVRDINGLMSAQGAEWYAHNYEAMCRLTDAINSWIGTWQSKYGKYNELILTQNMTDVCNVLANKLISVGNTDDKIELCEEIRILQGNMMDLMIEREREECEIIVENILNEVSYLKENFENRRKEVDENINKFGKIYLIFEKMKSSMNFQEVQGYEEKEKEKEREFQEVVSKGKELLNVNNGIGMVILSNYDGDIKRKGNSAVMIINVACSDLLLEQCLDVLKTNSHVCGVYALEIIDLILKSSYDSKGIVDRLVESGGIDILMSVLKQHMNNLQFAETGKDLGKCKCRFIKDDVNCDSDTDWDDYDGGHKFLAIDDGGYMIRYYTVKYVVSILKGEEVNDMFCFVLMFCF